MDNIQSNDRRPSVLVVIANQGWLRKEVAIVLMNMSHDPRYKLKFYFPDYKPYENGLAHAAQQVLKDGWDYMLIIDDDNPPEKNPLDLIELDKDIIGLPTPAWNNVDEFPIYWVVMRKVADGWKPVQYGDGLEEVDAVGSGCMLVHRRVLEAGCVFKREWDSNGIMKTGVDFHFCEQAKDKGFKIYAHWDYPCAHFKELNLTEVLAFKNSDKK